MGVTAIIVNPVTLTVDDLGSNEANLHCTNALVIPLTEILVMTKRNIWLIIIHSSHHCIFCLARNLSSWWFFSFIMKKYQNFTRIHIYGIILQVLILFEESNCLYIWLTFWLLSKREYTHIGRRSIHVVVSIKCGYWNTSSSG